MARLAHAGAEIDVSSANNNPDATNGIFGSCTRDTGTFRSGLASYKCDSGAGNAAAYTSFAPTVAASSTVYLRGYINFTNLPGSTVPVVLYGSLAAAPAASLRVTSAGVVQLFNDVTGTQIGSDGPTLSTGTWYRFELGITLDGSKIATAAEGRVDGTVVASGAVAQASSQQACDFGWRSAPGANKVLYVDDVAINDSTGSANNTWCGSGKVVLCKPVSDSQDGAWRGGAGGTGIDLSAAVDNTPPVGVVSGSATDTSQIESATASQTSANEYRANLTTYTNAGIGASDTINAIIPWNNNGEDIATNTKTGSFGLQANPAQAGGGGETTFTYGGDAGAIGSYPTNWLWTQGTITENPSVTLSSNPVLAVRKTDAGTRVASVDFMGLYVEYTPAVAGVVTIKDPWPALQAVNRASVY